MCGRYTLIHDLFSLKSEYAIDEVAPEVEAAMGQKRYNIAPGQDCPVIFASPTGRRSLRLLRWGLVPSWADDPKIGYKLINARSETVREKPSFKPAFLNRRCIVPADSFYEWIPSPEGKVPMRILPNSGTYFSFAGLWERWTAPPGPGGSPGKTLDTYSILTIDANAFMSKIHDRMPVILSKEAEAQWLDPELKDAETLAKLLGKARDEDLTAYAVDPIVNNARNDVPECIEPKLSLF